MGRASDSRHIQQITTHLIELALWAGLHKEWFEPVERGRRSDGEFLYRRELPTGLVLQAGSVCFCLTQRRT